MKKTRVLKTWSKRNVPDDIWPEVLSRLPVKSLLRFRSVSRSWRAAIDDPDFARLHLTRFSNNRLQSHLFVVQGTHRKPECAVRCSRNLRTTAKLGFFETDIPASKIVGSIDGLFMLKNWRKQELVLWNPSIRKTLIVPPFPQFSNDEFGLGFDPVAMDYKHVSFVLMRSIGLRFIAVYSVGMNSWKTTEYRGGEEFSSWRDGINFNQRQRTFCLRGVLYGLASDDVGAAKPFDLVTFNLNNEVFASVGLPGGSFRESGGLYHQSLTLMDGGCSIGVVNVSSDKGSVWVPESLGDDINSLSWTQRYTFATRFIEYHPFPWTPKFLHLKRNENGDDELLLKLNNRVVCYNLETHEDKCVLKKSLHEGNTWPYVESLILLSVH